MTEIICNFLNEIQDKHLYTHEDIIKMTNGEAVFILPMYEKAAYYFEMKEKGYRIETNIESLINTKEDIVIRDKFVLEGLQQAALIADDKKWFDEICNELNEL